MDGHGRLQCHFELKRIDQIDSTPHIKQDLLKALKDFISLIDMLLYSRDYAWSNNKEVSSFVKLDRFLISPS
jgi:hypothetical protein